MGGFTLLPGNSAFPLSSDCPWVEMRARWVTRT